MFLKTIGSGSSGNCYILGNDEEALILDCGVLYKEILKGLDFNISKVKAVLVSHEHLDHSLTFSDFDRAGVPIIAPWKDGYNASRSLNNTQFVVRWFDCKHDVPCYGFYITHPEIGTMIYATDTQYIKYRFKDLNHILIECNYSKDCLNVESYKFKHEVQDHMSQETCMAFLDINKSDSLRNVILCHLSNNAINEEQLLIEAHKTVNCPVYVADKGLEIKLTSGISCPFE